MRIGSITKTVFATAVLQAVAAGRLSLTATVQDLDPQLARAFPKVARYTVAQLLGMRTRIPDYADAAVAAMASNPQRRFTSTDLISLAFEKGKKIPAKGGYSTTNYIILGEVMQHVTSGKLQALAMTSDRRVPYWPQVPTLKESGYPEYEAYAWFGVVVAAATPRDIVTKMNADIVAVLRQPDMVERLRNLGADVAATTPEEFGRFLNAEHARWSAAVKAAKVTVQ